MRADNLAILERITLKELEKELDKHTLQQIPVDRWTEFSWSVSRHRTFESCKRQYYLNYYGSRRVRDAKSQIVSALWWLKQVTSIRAWIGTVIHNAAQAALTALRDGQEIDRDALASQAIDDYRAGIRASERGTKYNDQWIVLFEHVYPGDPFSIDRDEAEQRVFDLAHTLLESEAYEQIKAQPSAIREIDEPFQSFYLSGLPGFDKVRIFAIPDVLLQEGNTVHIIDWKTGGVEGSEIRDQAGIYRLYAHHRYDVPQESITVSIADLDGGGENAEPPGGTPGLDEAQALVAASIGAMVERIENLEFHTASIYDFPRTDDLTRCQQCGFKRACWRGEDVQ